MTAIPARVAGVAEVDRRLAAAASGGAGGRDRGRRSIGSFRLAARTPSRRWPTARAPCRASTRSSVPATAGCRPPRRSSAATARIDFYAGPTEILIVANQGRARLDCRRSHRAGRTRSRRARRADHAEPAARRAVSRGTSSGWCRTDGPARASLERHGGIIVCREPARRDVCWPTTPRRSTWSSRTRRWRARSRRPGALFVGRWTAQVAGDYAIGSNHVLPTAGAARFRGGLNAADFVRLVSVQRVTRRGLARLAPTITTLARAEGLERARARSIDDDRMTDTHDTRFKAFPTSATVSGCTSTRTPAAARRKSSTRCVRSTRDRPRDLSRLPRRGDRDRGVSRRRSGMAGADQRTRRRRAAGGDRLSRTRAPEALVECGASFVAPAGTAKSWSRCRRSKPTSRPRRPWGRASCRCRQARTTRFRSTACCRRSSPTHAARLHQQSEQPDGPAGARRTPFARSFAKRGTRSCSWTRRTTTSWARTFSTRALTYPNVLVGRTFSKAHGLAGMRIGVMIAQPALLEPIRFVHAALQSQRRRGRRAARGAHRSRVHAVVSRAGRGIEAAALRRARSRRSALLEERGKLRAHRRRQRACASSSTD